ncbi:MAG TPA: ATP-binding protein [Chitinophagaceae bacterium]|nr:ATP-binding protein [Chitinophagaceae bacterium]
MQNGQYIRIGVVDDDEDDFFIIKEYIAAMGDRTYSVHWCNNYASGIESIKRNACDIYFVDYRLGNLTGIDLLKETAAMGNDVPIVLLTGKGNKSIDIRAMENGATDYLVKSDLNTEKLERCIRYSLDRSAALREVRAREIKYRNLFENSRDAVFISDQQLFINEKNEAFSKLFGMNGSANAPHNLFEFIPDEDQKEKLKKLIEKGEVISEVEIQIEGKDKTRTPCLLSITPQPGSHGSAILHGIVHDITNLKVAELVNLQAEKLAANERLVRILAHEIRNPLNNISLSAENLRYSISEEGTDKDLFNILQRNCTRINQIIKELLNLTKLMELTFVKDSLQEILDESLSIASDRINLRHIEVKKNYPDKPYYINADRPKLVIAFTNIILNAIEAMPENKGLLQLSMSGSGDNFTVSIRDNGCGIPPEYLNKLFEPFFTMKKNGMGLGLATSGSIVQSHHGSVRVESVVDKGTLFLISFPVYKEEEEITHFSPTSSSLVL